MTDAAPVLDLAASHRALAELRRARRGSHREAVHWIDAIYRVYISALAAIVVVIVGSSIFGSTKLDLPTAEAFADVGIRWVGLAFALAAGVGLRSGGRGGPLTLQAATVQHELMAPVDYGVVLREPALKQLRFLGFAGACTGAIVATMGVRQLPYPPLGLVLGATAAFSVAMVLSVSLAMIFSGRRIGIGVANAIALGLLAWSAVDIVADIETSPFTLLGHLAFAGFGFNPLSLVPVVLALVAVPLALTGIGGVSVDDARRRAGLVAQLRFAVTLQDIRTVVLLRRQLSQETPRSRPWIRLRRSRRLPATSGRVSGGLAKLGGRGLLTAVWRRDWRSYLRFPAVRLARMLFLSMVAGLGLGLTWNGVKPAFLISALALYLTAYDAIEPLAQEIDHPLRWDGMPEDHGILLLRHLYAAFVVMLVSCGIAAATSLIWVPADVVIAMAGLIGWIVAFAAVAGAALSTVMGSPDMGKMMAGPGADVMGFILLFRLVFPPGLVIAALAPLFAAGLDPAAIDTARVQTFAGYTVLLAALSLAFVRFRKPSRI